MLLLALLFGFTIIKRHSRQGVRHSKRRSRNYKWKLHHSKRRSKHYATSTQAAQELDSQGCSTAIETSSPAPAASNENFTGSGFSCNGNTSGSASFYDVSNASENDGYTNQVSCGTAIPSDGLFVAIPSSCFTSSECNRLLTVTYSGKSITVPILDECASCESDKLDLSIGAWKVLESNTDIGILQDVSWS
eukprot:NODE_375_length_9841_cov_0.151098.p4 type:complete len:191 gc:universal NODE_375_length_9841_cov_0.151098:5572-6144(+)